MLLCPEGRERKTYLKMVAESDEMVCRDKNEPKIYFSFNLYLMLKGRKQQGMTGTLCTNVSTVYLAPGRWLARSGISRFDSKRRA